MMATTISGGATIQNAVAEAASDLKWKAALWEKDSVVPAMLRVPIIMVVFVALWGCNVWTLEKTRIKDYTKSTPWTFSFAISAAVAVIYIVILTLFLTMLESSVETGLCLFYVSLVVLIFMMPGSSLELLPGHETLWSFFRLLKAVFMPINTVSFPEVLLADAMTSISKVLKDVGVTIVSFYSQFRGVDIVTFHNEGMILIALLASLPFALRVRQCWVQLDGCTEFWHRVPVTLNLLKYVSAFPPIWLAAAASLGYYHPDLPMLTAVFATINSLYSYSWDICQDWGLFQFTRRCARVIPRQRMLLPLYCYVSAAAINLILRFAWTANRVPWLATLHPSHLLLFMELVEVGRRSMWFILRVEWEVIVQQEKAMTTTPGS